MSNFAIAAEPRALPTRRTMLGAFLLCVVIINAFAIGSLYLLQRDRESHQLVVEAALAHAGRELSPLRWEELQRVEEQKFRTERDLRVVLATMAFVCLTMIVVLFWRVDRLWANWKRALLETQHHAHHDDLTGLPNSRLLKDRLDVALAHARRLKQKVAVVSADFDGFTEVNELHGDGAGDEVLREAGTRLQRLCRDADTVARTAADEFVLVLSDVNSDVDVRAFAERLIASLSAPYEVHGAEIVLGASVGVALFSGQAASGETLVRAANAALVGAKRLGQSRVAFA
jgi:diguanylate cyclase (GGDEF)-like protein